MHDHNDQHAGSNRDWHAPRLATTRRHTRRLIQRSGDRLPRSPQLGLSDADVVRELVGAPDGTARVT